MEKSISSQTLPLRPLIEWSTNHVPNGLFLNESKVYQLHLGALRHHSLGSISPAGTPFHSLCGRQAAQACVKYSEASPEYLTFMGGLWRPVALRFVCESTDELQFLS